MTLRERLVEEGYEDVLLVDGLDEAFLGIGHRACQGPMAVYARAACIDVLVAQGLSFEDAVEHFEFNVACAWVGPGTPVFVDLTPAPGTG